MDRQQHLPTASVVQNQNLAPKYRADVDGLRAVAVLAVVAFHAVPWRLPGGFVGVDVFFVISGFLISSIIFKNLQSQSFSFPAFYTRRILRIFPPLILLLAFCLILGWFVLLPGEYAKLGEHVTYSVGFVVNSILNGEADYFDDASATKPLLHLWSLCIEEQFYIIWPLLLFAIWRWRKKMVVVLLIAFFLSFYLNVVTVTQNRSAVFFLGPYRFWELLIGGILAHFYVVSPGPRRWSPSPSDDGQSTRGDRTGLFTNAASAIGVALLLGAFAAMNKAGSFPGYWALVPTAGATLIIYAGPSAWINRKILSHRILVSIGLFSYPLYLWHWPLLSFNSILQFRQPTTVSKVVVVAASFLIAWFSNRFIEHRIRFGKHERIWVIPTALSAVLALFGFVGWQIASNAGYGMRFERTVMAGSVNNPVVQWHATPRLDISLILAQREPSSQDSQNSVLGNVAPEYNMAINGGRPNRPFVQDVMNYNHAREGETWRFKRCFLDTPQTAASFDPGCVDEAPVDKPLVLLWGDSNAASLSPGVRDLQKRYGYPFRFAQFTASGCPPALGFAFDDRPNCKGINDATYKNILTMKPALILLSFQRFDTDSASLEKMKRSVDMMNAAHPKRIILFGPSPTYPVTLPNYVSRQFTMMSGLDIPQRARLRMDDGQQARDKIIAQFAAANGIEFISIFDILCNSEGCILRVPYDELHDDLVQFDRNHLTEAGSRFVIDSIAPALLNLR